MRANCFTRNMASKNPLRRNENNNSLQFVRYLLKIIPYRPIKSIQQVYHEQTYISMNSLAGNYSSVYSYHGMAAGMRIGSLDLSNLVKYLWPLDVKTHFHHRMKERGEGERWNKQRMQLCTSVSDTSGCPHLPKILRDKRLSYLEEHGQVVKEKVTEWRWEGRKEWINIEWK